jgi:hypothetical protein
MVLQETASRMWEARLKELQKTAGEVMGLSFTPEGKLVDSREVVNSPASNAK